MKYFLIETDKGNHIPYAINSNRAIDIRYADRRNAYRLPNCCIVNMKVSMEVFFPDILIEPLVMVREAVADVIEMYAPETIFKTIYLLDEESEMHETYFAPFVEELECLSEKTRRSHGGTELLDIAVHRNNVAQKHIFRIAGFVHPYLIGRLDFVESMLRRDVRGISFTEIKVV